MAKQSVKARQKKREAMVAKYAEKRAALKAAGDYAALDLIPRIAFRDMALNGKIPGVKKASW